MKWIKKKPVRKGDILQLTVLGVAGEYTALRDADDAMNLRLCDLRKTTEAAE